jgi:hypothetical protein
MKLGMQSHVDESAGVVDEVAISFEANAVAFYAQISGLAKDKIGYPIRELATNAWDASRGHFEVHLPTALNPVFRVRDFGPGMSAADMKNVYARLYASTKRGSNDEVGGWGLGSKSPYAYLITDNGAGSYNVSSYHDGMMRTYVLSLSSQGAPTMRLLAEIPSDEPTGLDVSFSVRREDVREFVAKARQILWSFNPRPSILPAKAIDWQEPVINASGDNWTSYKTGTVPFNGPHVRMGCVMYPFDLRQIESGGFLDWNDDVLFDAPIGSLKVTLSREELAYDDNTKTTLTNLVKQYEDSFIVQLQEKVNVAETLFEAVQIFEDETESLGVTRTEAMRRVVLWNGYHLRQFLAKDNAKMMTLSEGWQQFDKFEDRAVRSVYAADATIVIEHNPNYSLSRFAMAGLIGKKVLWIRCKRIFRADMLAAIGNPADIVDLDSFKVPVEKRLSKTMRRRKTLMVMEGGKVQRVTQDIDMADGGIFIETSSSGYGRRRNGNDWFRIQDGTSSIQSYNLYDVIALAHQFGLVETGQVILIKGYDQPELIDDWIMLGDDLIPGLKAKIDVSVFTGLHKKTYNNLENHIKHLAELDALTFLHAPDDVVVFKTDLNRLARSLKQNSDAASTETDLAHAALAKLGVDVDKPEVACPLRAINDRFDALCKKYALLRQIVAPPNSYYGRPEGMQKHLKHYFELLSRPEVNLAEAEAAMDEEPIGFDEEDAADDVAAFDEAA